MIDRQGRNIDYMRISVTDRCNLRCRYCMPAEGVQQVSHSEILTFDEILRLAGIFGHAGIRDIKITGGEPLVRRGITGLIKDLKKVPGIETVTMTTNGILLAESLPALAEAGIDGINISLDTLQQDKYRLLTGTDGLHTVLDAIDAAGGYPQIKFKINTVTLADVNRSEVSAIAAIAATKSIDVRFIEMMPMYDSGDFGADSFISNKKVLEYLPEAVPMPHDGGVATLYRLPGAMGNIGLISPVNAHFCAECNRLRLTSDGKLKPCLHSGDEYSIKGLDKDGMRKVFEEAIWNKPAWHGDLDAEHRSKAGRNMNQIGG